MKTKSSWNKNSIQFPRLLSEICAIGLTEDQKTELCDNMDIDENELDELFNRAQRDFERIKERVL